MAATSLTGKGSGSSNKPTTTELGILANGPSIIFTGITEIVELGSPPIEATTYTFPYPLPGGKDSYVVMLTSLCGGTAYVTSREEDDDGNFTGFNAVVESTSLVQFLVAKVGVKPQVNI
jgi:hypothetical protein